MRTAFASHGEIYGGDDGKALADPQYIHLKNAKVHHPTGQLPTDDGVLWRGRINAVSGWNLGVLAADK
jgi:hypothetical protein